MNGDQCQALVPVRLAIAPWTKGPGSVGGISPGSWYEPGLKLHWIARGVLQSFSPGSCYEPGLMPPTEPGPLVHGAVANRTGTNAWHWSPFISEPGLMPNLDLDQSPVFY